MRRCKPGVGCGVLTRNTGLCGVIISGSGRHFPLASQALTYLLTYFPHLQHEESRLILSVLSLRPREVQYLVRGQGAET